MKSILLSLTFIFGLLFSMASCQNLKSHRTMSSYDIRSEIVYTGSYSLENKVAAIVKNANATKSISMRASEID
ncbi:hypothetical protein [Halobacteriovorax sp. HLS]|uniref:hypothetical protein n=1 Tax=Halobacteriovorax sp. HLS TaxID=2234000 RepID=UPI000FDBB571|nr:hypothetical protein [Halobacteriovorax sp. HLS]